MIILYPLFFFGLLSWVVYDQFLRKPKPSDPMEEIERLIRKRNESDF